tara:strand:+ start:9306 stop:9599 length:294 start_codon:yes stop_codon:yes gene_type:complete
MDTSYLKDWDVKEQQRRAEFMEHMYQCSGRDNNLFTGLWQDFCLNEAGKAQRDLWFERIEAVKQYIIQQEEHKELLKQQQDIDLPTKKETFVAGFHD